MTTPAENLVASRRTLVIGHRGYARRAPENTLPSFAMAVRAGADLVELDYFHSADGVPTVFHDETMDRTTDAPQVFGRSGLKIADLTLTELKQLDAGSWFAPAFAGTRIPTVSEAIDEIHLGSTTVLEHKGGDAATLIRLLQEKQVLNRVVVMSFDWSFVTDCHRLAPHLMLTALGDGKLTEDQLLSIRNTGARLVGWNQEFTHREEIATIHRHGFRAWVYTVNEVERARQLMADGIDGLISDLPGEIQGQALQTF